LGTPFSSTNKTDRHDITEILLNVAFNPNPNTFKGINNTNKKIKYKIKIPGSIWNTCN